MSKLKLAATVVQVIALAAVVYGVYRVSLNAAIFVGAAVLFLLAEAAGRSAR